VSDKPRSGATPNRGWFRKGRSGNPGGGPDRFPRSDIFTVVIGEENWREELAAAGRAGGVIRSALPIRDSPR